MGDELWCGQAQNGVDSEFDLKFGLEGQGLSLHKTIGTLTKLFYTFGPNLVILAWTGPELSRGQASDWHTDWHTHRHTDAGNDNTRRPNLASGKNCWSLRCSWSIACRRCFNYIFILNLTHAFSGLGRDNCKTRRETSKCWDLVRLQLEVDGTSASLPKKKDEGVQCKCGNLSPPFAVPNIYPMPTQILTHWGRDKMAATFADDIFKYISSNENFEFWIRFPWNMLLGV